MDQPQATKAQMTELIKLVDSIVADVDKIKSKFEMGPRDALGEAKLNELLKLTEPLRGLQKKLQTDFDPSTETEENVNVVIQNFKVLNQIIQVALNDTLTSSSEAQLVAAFNQLVELAGENAEEEKEEQVDSEISFSQIHDEGETLIANPSQTLLKRSMAQSKNPGVKYSQTEDTCSPSTVNISMMVLGGFIAFVGIAAVAIAFTVLNAATFGAAGIVVASVGAAAVLSGVGLFATGAYKNRQTSPDDSLDFSQDLAYQ